MEFKKIITQFDYQNKSCSEKVFDLLTAPLSYALGGKNVRCLDLKTNNLVHSNHSKVLDNPILFKENRSFSGEVHGILRIAAAIFAVAIGFFTAIGIIGKLGLKNPLAERYFTRRQEDTFANEDRVSNSLVYKFISLFVKGSRIENLQQAAHIHADRYLDNNPLHSPITEKESISLEQYNGDLFFRSAKMLREKLEKYINEPHWGEDVKKALKMAQDYEDWSYKMLSIMPLRFLFVNPSSIVNDLALDLKDRIHSLGKEESFLLPVCLRTRGGFHLITVGITKELDDTFTFSTYNVGLGSSSHRSEKNGDGKKSFYPYRITNIALNNITDIKFLKEFITHATFKEKDVSGNRFYEFLENRDWWGSQATIRPMSYKKSGVEESPRSKQNSGTCVWRSLLAGLKDNMPAASYKAFIYAMKRDDIEDIYIKYLEKAVKAKPAKSKKIKLNYNQKMAVILLKVAIDEFNKRNKKVKERHADANSDKEYALKFGQILNSLKERSL